jgi:tetratricopeptide (TPR) repeat protein
VVTKGVERYGESFRGEREVQADLLAALAAVRSSRGDYRGARWLLVAALAVRREVLGEDDAWVAETRIGLARLLGRLGEAEEAERLARLGLDGLRQNGAEASAELADALRVHAGTLLALERLDEAEALYREALERRIELLGDDHLDVAEVLEDLAVCLRRMDRPLEGEAAARRARSIRLLR